MTEQAIQAPGAAALAEFNYPQICRDMRTRRVGKFLFYLNPVFAYFFLWAPILILVLFSFNNSTSVSSWGGFSTQWYTKILGSAESEFTKGMLKGLQNTLFIGVISTLISTTLGTTVAMALERGNFPGKRIVDGVLYLPVVIPEITQAVSLAIFFNVVFDIINGFPTAIWAVVGYVLYGVGLLAVVWASWKLFQARKLSGSSWVNYVVLNVGLWALYALICQIAYSFVNSNGNATYGFATIIIGHVVFSVSFVVIVVRARLSDMNPRFEEAARDLGANEFQTFWRVTFPLILPGVISGGLLAFTLSLDDYIVTFFNNGVGTDTLPLFVYGSLRQKVSPEINALSSLMLIASMVLVGFSLWLQNRGASRT